MGESTTTTYTSDEGYLVVNPVDTQYYVDIISSSLERTIKRLWIVIVILIAVLVGTNAAWIYYESTFTETEIWAEQEADNGSRNIAIGGDYVGVEADG